MTELNGKTIAFLVAPEGIEQVELTEPWAAVERAGSASALAASCWNRLRRSFTVSPDRQPVPAGRPQMYSACSRLVTLSRRAACVRRSCGLRSRR